MKKIFLFFALYLNTFLFSQTFELTPENFRLIKSSDDYIILEFPNKNKTELFNSTKKFINTYYNNPKYVTSESENDQIVINAFGNKYNMTMFSWFNEYQVEILIKDEKIKLIPKFKWIKNYNGGNDVGLNMGDGQMWAVFNKRGKVMRLKAKEIAESDVNGFIEELKSKINNSKDW